MERATETDAAQAAAPAAAAQAAASAMAAQAPVVPGHAPVLPGQAAPPTGAPVREAQRPRHAAPKRSRRFHLLLLLSYLAAGAAVTWPRPADLAGRLPATIDQSSYVWDFWWVAHQVVHLGNPWSTTMMAAPSGVPLGFDTLMPLPAFLMTPVTVAFGPSLSYNLLTVLAPGIACYLAYRAARLWLASEVAAVAAGGFYGLASMVLYQDWYHLNIALGALFLPPALEVAVRLWRRPSRAKAAALGAIIGACFLVNQESVILAALIVAPVVVGWLVRTRSRATVTQALTGASVAVVVASPQIAAMAGQALSGNARLPSATVANVGDLGFGVPLPTLFAPSPRLATFGFGPVSSSLYHYGRVLEGVPTFGIVLSVLAVGGLLVGWRRRSVRYLACAWLGSAALALGPDLRIGNRHFIPFAVTWHGYRMSGVLPYTWLVQAPGMSGFREADRFALLGLLPAAILAGHALSWLRRHGRLAVAAVLVAAVLEAGYAGTRHIKSMPTAVPAVDSGIMADHSASVVVDVPFGIHGGVGSTGSRPASLSLVMATEDGHPRAISDTSWVPATTLAAVGRHPFYRFLLAAEQGRMPSESQLAAAGRDAHGLGINWAVSWETAGDAQTYLLRTGFTRDYQVGHTVVYRLRAAAH